MAGVLYVLEDFVAGFFSSLFTARRTEAELLADVVLMTALADGHLSETERDGLAQAMRESDELAGLSWEKLLARAEVLAVDAPLFFDARRDVQKHLLDPFKRRQSISLAAKIVGADRPLAEEEQAILLSLAESLAIPEREARALLDEAAEAGQGRFLRIPFNNPRDGADSTIFDAIAAATDAPTLAALLFKPRAIRCAITLLAEGGTLSAVGERMTLGVHHLRIDGTITQGERKWLLRCIARDEALHADERTVLKMLVEQLQPESKLVIVHEDELTASDEAFLDGLDPARVLRLALS